MPGEIYIVDNRLVFMKEQQGGFVWGVQLSGSVDPDVWQEIKMVGDRQCEWHREDLFLSDFIIAMWRWQITGEEPRRDASQAPTGDI